MQHALVDLDDQAVRRSPTCMSMASMLAAKSDSCSCLADTFTDMRTAGSPACSQCTAASQAWRMTQAPSM
jgi:hypothetical protein